jgi:hypothetical protein
MTAPVSLEGFDMPSPDWTEWLTAAKTTLDIFKGIRSELPTGSKYDLVQKEIEKAETSLSLSEAKLADALNYHLCQCTWPPQIMLWREKEKAYVCDRPECGRRIETRTNVESPVLKTEYF